MDGDLTVESTVGSGSRFTFTFEAEAAVSGDVEPADGRPLPTGIQSPHRRPKVLVVDDVAANRDLLFDLLSRVGLETRAAASGDEAIEVHDRWRPDLILMDLRMPGMDGLEATRRLRQSGSPVTVMALTASGLAETEFEAREAGVDDFMRKPYRERDLLARIAALLGLEYVYPPAPASASLSSEPVDLARLLAAVPAALAERLREAAMEGRAATLEDLAEDVRLHSTEAAAEIRAIARDFRYDALLLALHGGSR
jgi:CheY-like chemotaxis protein